MLASAHTGNILQRGIKKQNKERAQERRQVFAATHAGIHTQTRTHIVIAPRAVVAGRPESMPTSGGARRHRQAFCSSSAASSVPLAQEHFLPLKSPRAESSPLRKQQQQQQTGGRNRKKKRGEEKKRGSEEQRRRPRRYGCRRRQVLLLCSSLPLHIFSSFVIAAAAAATTRVTTTVSLFSFLLRSPSGGSYDLSLSEALACRPCFE